METKLKPQKSPLIYQNHSIGGPIEMLVLIHQIQKIGIKYIFGTSKEAILSKII